MASREFYFKCACGLALLGLFLSSCQIGRPSISGTPDGTLPTTTQTGPAPTLTPFQPSPTPLPAAAVVNGDVILLTTYEAALVRYSGALGRELAEEERQQVLADLIDEQLLVQAANREGYPVDEPMLQQRLDALAEEVGGQQALQDWMARYGYTEEDFRMELARSIAAAWMRDQIIAAQPLEVEQVHARQILVSSLEKAGEILSRLQAGEQFAEVAAEVDPVTEGDLGWFPQGYLLHPDLEAAAFQLQPGEISAIVQTPVGYHLLQVIERDPQRPLDPEPLRVLQGKLLQSWLEEQRQASTIEITLP